MSDPGHIPVLLAQTLAVLAPRPGETVVDCTIGRGGHALAFSQAIGARGTVIGFDLDPANLQFAGDRLRAQGPAPFVPIHDSFAHVARRLAPMNRRADVVLADLGFSSTQMDDPSRGLSFSVPGPLDMRLDPGGPVTAAELANTLSETELADMIWRLGEEPLARRIARKLAQFRLREPIRSTDQLAGLVVEAYGPRARQSRLHPATRTFMAFRIAVNGELEALEALLEQVATGAARAAGASGDGGVTPAHRWLNAGARVAVISFHSLEDRLVKHAFADLARTGLATRLTKRPIRATEHEQSENPRARSAKLRAAQLTGDSGHQDSGGQGRSP